MQLINKCYLSDKANKDLDRMTDYTLNLFEEIQTRTYVTNLLQCFQSLADKPEIGRRAAEFAPLLRKYNYRAHSVFYEPTED